ncbi:hypothetical protein Tco_0841943 [Tanacetum coccineum]|uniref:Uncharacterized protein n=1 Tax=Tanacetum coccineum TaxID=301880 RepID=A0ABQ5AYT4_9ASTR
MSSDSAVTYTSVHSEARSWSIPSEDPYEEAARQLLEQAPRPSEYVPDPMELEDHCHYITEVASAPTLPLPPPSLLPTLIRPPHTRAVMAQRRATAPSIYHSLLLAGTPPLLPIPLPTPSTSHSADIPEADTPPRKRLLLTAPTPKVKVGDSSVAAAARQPGSTMARGVDHSFIDTVDTRVQDTERRTMAAVEVVNLRAAVRLRLRYLGEIRLVLRAKMSIETPISLARLRLTSMALEARPWRLDNTLTPIEDTGCIT